MGRDPCLVGEAVLSGSRSNFMNLRVTNLHCFDKCVKNGTCGKCNDL